MADIATLETALRNAHKAGDENAARMLANEIMKVRSGVATSPAPQQAGGFEQFKAMHPDLGDKMQSGNTLEGIGQDLAGLARTADDSVRTFVNGMTLGFADKTVPGSPKEVEREKSAQARERLGPVASPALEIGGSMVPMLTAGGLGLTATRLPGAIGRFGGMALDGAGFGALQAVGNDQDVATGAALGAAGGAVGQVAGKGIQKLVEKLSLPSVPSLAQITSKADDLYKAADAEGVMFSNDAVQRLVGNVEGKYAARAADPLTEPGAMVALRSLASKAANGVPFEAKTLQGARRIANEKFIPGNKTNNALLNELKGAIDDLRMNPQPGDVLAGDATKAAKMTKEADALWSQKKKIEALREAVAKAESRAARTGSGGNTENTVKQELAKIIDDPRKGRGFTPDERKAVEDVVFNQSGRDTLRLLGKLSPFRHGGAAALGVGGLMLEPVTAGTTMAVGTGSKLLANAIQKAKVNDVERLIAVGGDKTKLPQLSDGAKRMIEMLKRALAISGTTALASEASRR